jgi:hypothetical protein
MTTKQTRAATPTRLTFVSFPSTMSPSSGLSRTGQSPSPSSLSFRKDADDQFPRTALLLTSPPATVSVVSSTVGSAVRPFPSSPSDIASFLTDLFLLCKQGAVTPPPLAPSSTPPVAVTPATMTGASRAVETSALTFTRRRRRSSTLSPSPLLALSPALDCYSILTASLPD